jgi:predicted porin
MAVAGALAAPCIALAQSSVEVYGTINMALGYFKYSESTAGLPSVSKWDVAQGASNYGLRGRESIGGGLTAWFQLEENAPMERSNNIAITPASRNSAVGIQGGFGNIFLGQWTTPWADLDALWSIGTVGFWGPVTSIIGRRETTGTAPNANCINTPGRTGAPAFPAAYTQPQGTCDAVEANGGVGHTFWRRTSQSVFYQSPVFSGFALKLGVQTNEGKATVATAPNGAVANPWLVSSSVEWAGFGGRARVGVAYDKHHDFTSVGNSDNGYAVKGGWNFGVVDVGLAYEAMTYKCGGIGTTVGSFNSPTASFNGAAAAAGATSGGNCLAGENDVKAKQYGIALAVPVGQGAIRASYAKAKDLQSDVSSATLRDKTGAKMYVVGYDHRFSKRTTVGVGYAKIDNDANAQFTWTGAPPTQGGVSNTPSTGSDPSTFYVSITHRF